jgi:hypothetical protein
MDKYDQECIELTEMTREQLLSWTMMPDCPDRLIRFMGPSASLWRLTGTEVDYLVADTSGIPGLKIAGVWHSDSMYHPLFQCECCRRGPLTRDGS